MILGLSGAKGSGKDTVAAYLVKNHQFERKAFADPMKKSIAALFDIPFSEVDKLKNEDTCIVSLATYGPKNVGSYEWIKSHHDMTFRTLLQRYGTEAHRDVFGEDFWLDYTLPVGGYYPGRAIVVTDVRFANEANRVKELGGTNVMITRPGFESEEEHRSEVFDFNADLSIINNGDIDDLYVATEEILTLAGWKMYVE